MLSIVPGGFRDHVHRRLTTDLIAWLTTVRGSGAPDTVPVWFVWDDDAFVIYSEPDKPKLHNIARQSSVSIALDDTRGGDDVVRFEASAQIVVNHPPADRMADYVTKYDPHIRRLGYGDPAAFAAKFRVPILVTPNRFRRWV